MASNQKRTQGGTPEQHAEAGRQSHKNDGNKQSGSGSRSGSESGGSKQSGSGSRSGSGGGTRGGTPEQHAEAGRQSHKNDKR
ncbi:hypothetical protein [Massilia niabensis]|uniref:Stress-induced protein n=1 Tax=Massilia niabensis TaxID=544910 RepID=A0ABW0L993_9BURK